MTNRELLKAALAELEIIDRLLLRNDGNSQAVAVHIRKVNELLKQVKL